MQTVLFITLNNIRKIAIMLLPVIPTSSEKILNLLNINDADRTFKSITDENIDISDNRLGEVTPIFPKVEISDE
jgi:methionyl-tRNA synthetase